MIDNSKIIADTGALEQLTEEERRMLKSRGNRPEMIQIPMDRQGWVSVSEFIEKFNDKFRRPMFYLTLPVLMEIVRTDGKQRYGLRREGDKLMIRCNQGHSIPWLEMDYKVGTPPWNRFLCAGFYSERRTQTNDTSEGSPVLGYRNGKTGCRPMEKSGCTSHFEN